MARRFNSTVHLHATDAGGLVTTTIYAVGDLVPDGVEVGDHVWDEDGTAAPATKAAAPAKKASSAAAPATGGSEPPRVGTGSAAKDWATYAKSVGLEVPKGAKKAEIITLVDAAKAAEKLADPAAENGDEPVAAEIPGADADIDAWRTYAVAHDFDFSADDDASVDDVIAALRDAGVPTE